MGRNLIAAVITSFGYRHDAPPPAAVTLDVRTLLRDPHVDPRFRRLTGHDPVVRAHVLSTPGAAGLLIAAGLLVAGLLVDVAGPAGIRVDVAIGCAGGRHRSVALADLLAVELAGLGHRAVVEHRDIGRPVLAPG